ncbi:hypothetical protein SDC9_36491 [bioreactor metagenome]|uniref:Uncharacterized protein n=1 Tax=bioreactor metagenome TaxID=1076179 RepID=A0A644VGP2_9ZZZZ
MLHRPGEDRRRQHRLRIGGQFQRVELLLRHLGEGSRGRGAIAVVPDQRLARVGLEPAVDQLIGEIDVPGVLQQHEAAGPGQHAFLRVHELDRHTLLLQRHRRGVPGHCRHQLARGQRLLDRGHVGGIARQHRTLFAQLLLDLLQAVGVHVEGAHPRQKRGDDRRVMHRVDGGKAARILRIPEHVPALLGVGRDHVGAVENRGIAPVPRHHPDLAIARLDIGQVAQHREDIVPVLDPRGVDRLQQAFLVPARDLVIAGMGDIGVEARLDLGEGVVVIAEDRGLERVGMRLQEALAELGQLIARPGEIAELVLGQGGRGDPGRKRQGEQRLLHWCDLLLLFVLVFLSFRAGSDPAAPTQQLRETGKQGRDQQDQRAERHHHRQRFREAQLAPDIKRQRGLRAGEEIGDDELVERGEEGQRESRANRRPGQRQHGAAEHGEIRGAKIGRRLGDRARDRGETRAQHGDRGGQADQNMAQHDRDPRRPQPGQVDEDQQRDADDHARDQDRQPREHADQPRQHGTREDLEIGDRGGAERRDAGRGERDDQAVLQRLPDRRGLQQRAIPLERQPLHRERRLDRIVERKQRDQRDGQVEKDDIGADVDRQQAALFHVRLPQRRSACRTSATAIRMTSMVAVASAAPKGQSLALPNCAWIRVPIIVLAGPPTIAGVT